MVTTTRRTPARAAHPQAGRAAALAAATPPARAQRAAQAQRAAEAQRAEAAERAAGSGGASGGSGGATGGSGGQGASGGGGSGGSSAAPLIGPRPVSPTAESAGTLFAATDGTGSDCTKSNPCDAWEVVKQAGPGDVVFFRGGTYPIAKNLHFRGTGTASQPIIYESYPGELAVLDGSQHSPPDDQVHVRITGTFVHLRRMEIKNMPRQGLHTQTTDNLIEGLKVHGNGLTGIQIYSPYDDFPYGAQGSRNTIRDCTVYDNDGSGYMTPSFADGGNSDGISVSSGADNRIEHCLVYGNSDDGIDTWRSTDSYVGYSIVHSSGIGSGNGNGIKAGGAAPSARTTVEHCLSYSNQSVGFDFNSGVDVTFRFNTSWDNGRGFWANTTTTVEKNIAAETNAIGGSSTPVDNSWQRSGSVSFISTDPGHADFLKPTAGGGFEDIGAYAGL